MSTTTTRSLSDATATTVNSIVQRHVAASTMAAAAATATSTPTASSSSESANIDVNELSSSLQHFGWIDYFVFVLMLVICAIIGFYFGFIEKRKKKHAHNVERRGSEALDYLVGGRKMKVFPVSLSLVASFVSGISLLGTSTEIYVYGTQYAFTLITLAFSGVISWYVFLPVFCNLQLTSTYEYFEMRFDKNIRLLGSTLFIFGVMIWLPFVIYIPALAFNQVTGVNIHIVTPLVCLVCIFYTTVGGLKAVVWTDVIQTVLMVGAIFVVIIKGTIKLGGFGVVWQRNYDSGRIEFPAATWDITERVSLLGALVGGTFYFTQSTACNQVIMQRYLCVPGLKEVKSTVIYFTLGIVGLTAICYYNGLLIFATYYDCDPLTTKLAKAGDQLVPLMVMDILKEYPGMPGLFVAGVFSAALSSLSTGLNSLAAVCLEDYVKPLCKTPPTEFQTAIIMRLTVVIIGFVSVGLVFVVESMGTNVLPLSMTLGSITNGPLLGLFLMGLLMPWINSKSAIAGSMLAFGTMAVICIKGHFAKSSGELVYETKPVSIEGCTYDFEPPTITMANSTVLADVSKSFTDYIFHMSFLFYCLVGALLSMIYANCASFVFGRNDPKHMDINLFSPVIRGFLKANDYDCVKQQEQKETYFEMRFGRGVRYFASVLFTVGMILYLPVAMYVPALTFNQVSGISIHIITPIVCLVCTFYTCVGGLKAVVWTDVIQSFVMYGTVLVICIKGTLDLGGLDVVIERNAAGGRFNAPDMTWDPTVRLSMLSVLVGGTLHKIQSSDINQMSLQRFLSLPNYEKAKQAMFVFTVLLILLLSCCCYMGLLTYATYHDCDPLTTKQARASDQLPTLLVMRILGAIPGAPGLFVAGVFSAALSSLSTGLNSLACVISQDLFKTCLRRPLSERQMGIFMRCIVVGFGMGCIGLMYLVEKMGMVLQLSTMTSAVSMGPLLGVYFCGVCLPWINQKSILTGSVVSFVTVLWVCANAQIAQLRGEIYHPKLPVSVEGCSSTYNITLSHEAEDHAHLPERNIYHLSFYWYTAMGGFICLIVSCLATLVFGVNDLNDIDPMLITPFMLRFLPKKKYTHANLEIYLEKRFDHRIRVFGSLSFLVLTILWTPISMYVPALTFNQVTGVDVHVITPIVSLICIFYTCIGGIRGVIWTDVLQGVIMIGSILLVVIRGTLLVGGLGVVVERNWDSGRLEAPTFTLDPTVRMSFFAIFVGGALFKLQIVCINQTTVQRFLTLPNLEAIKKCVIYSLMGFIFLLGLCIYLGLLTYAAYYDCDPISTQLARAKDQVVPMYVMEVAKDYPGIAGLFVSGVCSAALSSLSTVLNAMSGVVLKDFIEPNRTTPLTERQTAIILRSAVIIFGLMGMTMVGLVEKLGLVMQLSATIGSFTGGPLLGIFTVGMVLPFVNTKYFERRFSRRIRLFGAGLFTLKAIVWLPIAVYVPALTLNQMSGIDIHVLAPVVIIICTFYTTVGGIKGVIWTDVVQSFVMFGAMIVLMIKGTADIGGIGVLLQRNWEGGRLITPEWTLDPTVRLSMLSIYLGETVFKLQGTSIVQPAVQRFMSLPSLADIKKAIIYMSVGLIFLYIICIYVGLLAYATFYDCDPISTGLANARDQLIPLLVMQVMGIYPGMPGLFVAGVFSAALSSISTLLNSLSAVFLEDFVKPHVQKPLSERKTAIILRSVVVFFGCSSICLVYVVQHLGMVLQLSMTLQSIIYGPMIGIFTVGMVMPWVNEKSILAGSTVAFFSMMWITVNAQYATITGKFNQPKLPVTVEGCDYDFDMARYLNSTTTQAKPTEGFEIYHISFMLYAALGASINIIISNLAGFIFGFNKLHDVDEKLLSPFMARWRQKRQKYRNDVANPIEKQKLNDIQ